ncbi:MAG: rhomboid family intramembrane serine protease [Candidatus Pacearchaeota archaeon]
MKKYTFSSKSGRNIFSYFSVNSNIIFTNVILFVFVWGLLLTGVFSETFFSNNIALSLENIENFRFWTFLTSMFMHGGFFHLFVNMLSLFFLGGLLEKILGPKRYFGFYMISGLFAGLLYIIFELIFPSGLGAVGASGALFGLVGLLVLLTPNLPVYAMFIPVPIKMKYAGPGILVLLWLISVWADIPIGNTAHLGGLIIGLTYGIYLRKKYKRKTRMIRNHFK